MSMRRRIGNSGLEVGPLALGGNVFGWTANESTSFKLLDAFVAAGFTRVSCLCVSMGDQHANRRDSGVSGCRFCGLCR